MNLNEVTIPGDWIKTDDWNKRSSLIVNSAYIGTKSHDTGEIHDQFTGNINVLEQ